jgi:hypothetical protein
VVEQLAHLPVLLEISVEPTPVCRGVSAHMRQERLPYESLVNFLGDVFDARKKLHYVKSRRRQICKFFLMTCGGIPIGGRVSWGRIPLGLFP